MYYFAKIPFAATYVHVGMDGLGRNGAVLSSQPHLPTFYFTVIPTFYFTVIPTYIPLISSICIMYYRTRGVL